MTKREEVEMRRARVRRKQRDIAQDLEQLATRMGCTPAEAAEADALAARPEGGDDDEPEERANGKRAAGGFG